MIEPKSEVHGRTAHSELIRMCLNNTKDIRTGTKSCKSRFMYVDILFITDIQV